MPPPTPGLKVQHGIVETYTLAVGIAVGQLQFAITQREAGPRFDRQARPRAGPHQLQLPAYPGPLGADRGFGIGHRAAQRHAHLQPSLFIDQ